MTLREVSALSSSFSHHHGFLLHVRGHCLCQEVNFGNFGLRIDPFAYGQLYTALSRVRHRDDCLLIFSEENEGRDSASVVYTSLLL